MKEKLFFADNKRTKLCGVLSNPTLSFTKPIVILAHGFASNKDSKSYLDLEEKFNQRTISTFRFDFHDHGESEGKFEDLKVSQAAEDILSAIAF